MDKREIKDLLIQIKVFFPRFESVEKDGSRFMVMTQTVDSWYRQLGFMTFERALEILDKYMQSENGSKTPSVSLWLHNGKMHRSVWHNARLDLRNGVIVWQPEGSDETYERKIVHDYGGTYEDEEGYLWAYAGGEA